MLFTRRYLGHLSFPGGKQLREMLNHSIFQVKSELNFFPSISWKERVVPARKMFTVYLLPCPSCNTRYIGSSSLPFKRILEHTGELTRAG